MGDGLPKPKSTIDTIKSRRQTIDDAEQAAVGAEEAPEPVREPRAKAVKLEPKGMPKPGLISRVKRLVGLE